MAKFLPKTSHQRYHTIALVLILVFFGQVIQAARHTSITLDESLHITSGYACLVTGDYRLVEEHPPLIKMLQAFPLLFAEPRLPDPRTLPGWEEGNLIFASQSSVMVYQPLETLVFAARVPTMLVGVILAAFIYRWATDAFGPAAGLLALALYGFDPNMLGHAGVAATDLGATCAIFASMYTFWRWIRARQGPDWKRMAIAAVVLGLALGVKSTVLMVIPIFGAFILWGRPPEKKLKPYIFQALIACGIAFAVLWGLYRFEFGPAAGVPFPIPMPSHLLPLLRLQQHMGEGHSAFLMGQNYHQGRWIYFPIAFTLKTPLLTLGLLLLTIPGLLLKYLSQATTRHDKATRCPWLNRKEIFMVSLPVLYFGVSMNSGINIGYRHLLPVLPFIYVWVSRIALLVQNKTDIRHSIRSGIRWAGGILVMAYAATTLLLFPWHLSYFNAIAGGPDNGWKFLADSNTDWGQTLRALARYQEANDLGSVKLSMFIFLDPAMYNVEYEPIAPMTGAIPVLPRRFNPEPGLYAISATTLDGVPLPDPDSYDWFRNHEPFTKIGYVTFLYQVEPNEREWLAQCTQPVTPIDDSRAIAEGFGSDTLRQIYFNCEESWIWPEQGNTDGWYALNTPGVNRLNWPPAGIRRTESLELWPTWTQRLNFEAMHKSYTQRQSGNLPPFTIWEWNVGKSDLGLNQEEIEIADTLVFLGYDAPASARAGETLEVITYWRVVTPPGRPLSLMLHLLDLNGAGVAVGDGLGVPVNQWQAGDVIAQRHPLQIPGEAKGEAVLVTGAYWLDTMERLVSEDEQDTIRLSSVSIR